MVSVADYELAPDVVWVGVVEEIRDYPTRAAAEAAFEAMQ
jgi:hypothetical protein